MTIEDIVEATECIYDDVVVDVGVLVLFDQFAMMFDRDMGDDFEAVYDNPRITHGTLGVDTEVAELKDAFKRHWFYHKELDTTNVFEEIGDISYYITILEDEVGRTFYGSRAALDELAKLYGSSLDECEQRVISKLKVRYPDGFSTDKALNRDLDKEREVLEDERRTTS